LPKSAPRRIDADWLYGGDIIRELQRLHPEWNFRFIDGSHKDIWESVDILIRPVRHDAISRMILEAKERKIPFWWSYMTGKYVEPTVREIEQFIIREEKNATYIY